MTQSQSLSRSPLHVVVLGGGYAGVLAANRVAGALAQARITLVSERDELVHRIRLHEALAGRPFRRYPLARLLHPRVQLLQGRVDAVHARERRVEIAGHAPLSYDALLIALGSRMSLGLPGAREHAAWLATPDSARAGAARLAALPDGAPVAVVGGGLTAIESATEIAEAHPRLQVTMLASTLGAGLSEKGRAYLRTTLSTLGVQLREGLQIESIRTDEVIARGEVIPSAMTVWAAGMEPAGPALDTDLPRDDRGRLVVDESLRVPGFPEVFVGGDAAAPAPGMEFLRMGCVTAMPMGAHAADGVVRFAKGLEPQPFRFAFNIQCISLGRRRALVQQVDSRDRPLERIVTGRQAALVKELICRFVVGALHVERRWSGAFRWSRALQAQPVAPPSALAAAR